MQLDTLPGSRAARSRARQLPAPAALAAAALVAVAAPAAPVVAQQGPRPVRITTTDAFDPATIPPYQGDHPDVYAYIDAHRAEHLENLRRWVRQPSVSAENIGVLDMANLLMADLRALGFGEVELAPTSGHPGVFGYYDAGAEKTLVVYMMYDVQPVNPEDWQVDPFAGELVDHALGRALMARGATNQKGPQRAFLNAVESILETRGTLPVNLMVVAEGEEELGSPHYPEVIDRYEARMRAADGVLFPMNGQSATGEVGVSLGVKGIVYFELEATGTPEGGPKRAEVHSSLKAIVDSPVWRLTQALASLTSEDGNTILVPGYYDAIRQPNAEEQRLFNGMLPEWTRRDGALRGGLAVDEWVDDVGPEEALRRYLFGTTLNIDGIWGGYTGPGVKTILPHKATAKLDSRLVPDQTPEQALQLIREHLDREGFGDVEVRLLSGYPPAQTSVEAPLVRAAISAYNKHGHRPAVAPRIAGSAPYYLFTQRLGLPMVPGGLGHGSGAHAPNEYMVVEPKAGSTVAGLPEIEKFYVDLLYALAQGRPTS